MKSANLTETTTLVKHSTQASAPWVVIIYDDPVNLMDYVTQTLQKVLGYDVAKAHELMQQIHNRGKAIVWSGNKEKAEFYVQQFHTFQLNATFEIV